MPGAAQVILQNPLTQKVLKPKQARELGVADEIFEAADFLMDYLKSRAPFWKKEHRRDGSQGGWVDAKESDDAAAAKWGGGLRSPREP